MDDGVGSAQASEQARIDDLWHSMHRDIRRRGVDVHLADDVAQETWLRVAARPTRMDRPLGPWLWVVGARVLAELRRRDLSRSARERRAARPGTTPGEVTTNDDSRVMKLVAELPSPYREVISLRYVEDLEIEEIARRLERSPGTVRSQLKRGLERLRVRLDESEERGERAGRSTWSFLWLRFWRGQPALGRRVLVGLGAAVALVGVAFFILRSDRSETRSDAAVAGLSDRAGQSSTNGELPHSSVGTRTMQGEAPDDAEPSIALVPPRPASGTVRFPDGTPAAGATVWQGSGKGKGARVVSVTDTAGRYSAEAIDFDRFLWATLPGWLPSRRTHVGSSVAGSPNDLVLASSRGRLTLRVSEQDGQPVARAEVELDWGFDRPDTALFTSGGVQYESETESGTTDDLGRLELALPPTSTARLRVRMEGRIDHVESLALAEGVASLEVVLPRAAFLRGTVVDASGLPIPAARVEMLAGGGKESSIFAASPLGAFEVALDPGPFELRVREAFTPQRRAEAKGVLEPDEARSLVLVLGDEEMLRGRVLAAGQPVAGAIILCTSASAASPGPEQARTYSDSDGRFAFSGRSLGERVGLRVYSPAFDLLCERESLVGPEEVVLTSGLDPSARQLVLEFETEDPAVLPTLVEVCSMELQDKVRDFPVHAGTRTCALLAPRTPTFRLFPFVPDLGTWQVERAELEPGDHLRLRVPRPGRITFQLDLPPGIPASAVRGGMRVHGLNSTFVTSPQGLLSIRELRPDPATLSAEAPVFPGSYRYSFQGPGLAQAAGVVRIAEGESLTEIVRMDPGIEARVLVRFPSRAVTPVLAVQTSEGHLLLDVVPVLVAGSEAVFQLGLPAHSLALQARAQGLFGTRVLLPGELVPRTPIPEFSIELVSREPLVGAGADQPAPGRERE